MKKLLLTAAALAAVAVTAPAQAAGYLYMTGASDPWGNTANDAAMDAAFGAGSWTKANGFNAGAFAGGYDFIYFDGGDGTSAEFNGFVSSNLAAIESYVNGGGRVLLNAARWDFTPGSLALGFGATLEGDNTYSLASNNASLTAAGLLAGLDANGAGNSWTGGHFSHDRVTGVDTCYVSGDQGCVFGSKGTGLFVGGQTTANFHSAGGHELRVNELLLAANGGGVVPEPATWAMMILGFGVVGGALRSRRKRSVRFAF